MCALLSISCSGFYQYLRQKDSNRHGWQKHIIKEIKQVYGSPRIQASLIKKGIETSRLMLERYRRATGIRSIMRKK
jgi:putative transposase